jgi:hypothetical protein
MSNATGMERLVQHWHGKRMQRKPENSQKISGSEFGSFRTHDPYVY